MATKVFVFFFLRGKTVVWAMDLRDTFQSDSQLDCKSLFFTNILLLEFDVARHEKKFADRSAFVFITVVDTT